MYLCIHKIHDIDVDNVFRNTLHNFYMHAYRNNETLYMMFDSSMNEEERESFDGDKHEKHLIFLPDETFNNFTEILKAFPRKMTRFADHEALLKNEILLIPYGHLSAIYWSL